MKAVLEFNLPEESEEHRYAINGVLYSIVIDEALGHIRQKLKYEDLTDEQARVYEELRAVIVHALNERNINA